MDEHIRQVLVIPSDLSGKEEVKERIDRNKKEKKAQQERDNMATATKKKTTSKDAKKAAPRERTVKSGKCVMTGRPTKGGTFAPGQDAVLRGMCTRILAGDEQVNVIPKAARANVDFTAFYGGKFKKIASLL